MTLTEFAKEHAFYKGHEELTSELFKKYIVNKTYSNDVVPQWIEFIYKPRLLLLTLESDTLSILLKLVESGYDLPFVNCSQIRYDPDFFIKFIQHDFLAKYLKYPNLTRLLKESSFKLYNNLNNEQKDVIFKGNAPTMILDKFFADNIEVCYNGRRFDETIDILFDVSRRRNEIPESIKNSICKSINQFNPTQVVYGTLITEKRIEFYGDNEFECEEIPQTSLSELSKYYTLDEIKKLVDDLNFVYRGLKNIFHDLDLESFIFFYENSNLFKKKQICKYHTINQNKVCKGHSQQNPNRFIP